MPRIRLYPHKEKDPVAQGDKLATFLAENFDRATIREAYGALSGKLPPPPQPSAAKVRRQAARNARILKNLSMADKQSLVDLLFNVQMGYTSCRRAATEIQDRIRKDSDDSARHLAEATAENEVLCRFINAEMKMTAGDPRVNALCKKIAAAKRKLKNKIA